jgi:hypothetical protein
MEIRNCCLSALVLCVALSLGTSTAAAQGIEDIEKPKPVVPEIFTLQGEFVRMAYNNEGFVTLGYRTAQNSVGQDWMLLEVGLTLVGKVDDQPFTREGFSLQQPDGSTTGLATQEAYNKGNLRALDARANTVRDSINYFPSMANRPCRIGFFADASTGGRTLAYDQVTLSRTSACVGRIYFQIPGGITTGQYYLNVKFKDSVVQVPFRIMTDEESKEFKKQWKDIKKEHEAGYKEQE